MIRATLILAALCGLAVTFPALTSEFITDMPDWSSGLELTTDLELTSNVEVVTDESSTSVMDPRADTGSAIAEYPESAQTPGSAVAALEGSGTASSEEAATKAADYYTFQTGSFVTEEYGQNYSSGESEFF